ncbi:MAG: hypothetical protein IJW99_01565 [Clostridia bacterium]|nr:hypothetical protein [Clostridia bacterium]
MKKQLVCALLLGAMLLTSCAQKVEDMEETTAATGETTVTVAKETEKTVSTLSLITDGKCTFTITRSEEASSAMVSNTKALHKNLQKFTSSKATIGTDWTRKDAEVDNSKPEILVGVTNRRATQELLADLPPHSYGIRVTEDKVVIVGTSENMTAYGLYAFESQFLLNKEYAGAGYLNLPVGTEVIHTSESLDQRESILRSTHPIAAYVTNDRNLSERNGFTAAQGAATDGTYFYNVLKKKEGNVETDILVKSKVSDFSEVAVSAEMPLDHANDMTYDSKRNLLVIPNMLGKIITRIDPETLTVVSEVDAPLPGTPWAIAYNATRDCYVVAAGGRLCITDENFVPKTSFPTVSSSKKQVGQGMDADDEFIYMPLSPDSSEGGNKYNVIMVYDWNGNFVREVPLELTIETETILHFEDEYYMNFNISGGGRVSDLHFAVVYS